MKTVARAQNKSGCFDQNNNFWHFRLFGYTIIKIDGKLRNDQWLSHYSKCEIEVNEGVNLVFLICFTLWWLYFSLCYHNEDVVSHLPDCLLSSIRSNLIMDRLDFIWSSIFDSIYRHHYKCNTCNKTSKTCCHALL